MKPNPLGLVLLGGLIFWSSFIALWWSRGLHIATAVSLGILMGAGGILVIVAGMIDPKEPRE
jgi:hypothetical protein